MPNTPLSHLHQTWVMALFQRVLEILKNLDLAEDSPRLFLVYAHDSHAIGKKADDAIARQLIHWLRELGANIYSDRTAGGNSSLIEQLPPEIARIHDIL